MPKLSITLLTTKIAHEIFSGMSCHEKCRICFMDFFLSEKEGKRTYILQSINAEKLTYISALLLPIMCF